MTPPPALLVAGHGTFDEAGAEAFRSFVRLLEDRAPGLPVGGGLTGDRSPSFTDAVAELAEKHKVRRFAVVPLALGRADHAPQEIRAVIEHERERHPGTSFAYRPEPLGPHPALLDLLERRLEEVLGDGHRTPSDRAHTTVLLAGRGSSDPEANAELFRVARLLWEGRGYGGVEAAFVGQTAPDVPAGLDRCARLGAGAHGGRGRIVVAPYFLLDGVLPGRLRQQAEGWAEANSSVDVRFAEVLGGTPQAADLVMERYAALRRVQDESHAGDTA